MEWQRKTPVEARKALGQYMTPDSIRQKLLELVDQDAQTVLDPGVGTGEFLESIARRNPRARLVGWDIDPNIIEVARKTCPTATLEPQDALNSFVKDEFDLVVGNPPYFQFSGNADLRKRFGAVISGRPNIFALFFQVGLEAVKPGGQLAYVVPTSMNTGAYFSALRTYILSQSEIEHIVPIEGSNSFADAQTSVQILVLRKGKQSQKHVFSREIPGKGERTVFSPDVDRLESIFAGRKTLYELGYVAATGQIVWNQAKDRLRESDADGAIRLIWARDIQAGEIGEPTIEGAKLPFVDAPNYQVGPAVIVNRIVGSVGNPNLKAALVPPGVKFLGENHVNVILPRGDAEQHLSMKVLCDRLGDSATADRLLQITGNTQVSATELTHLVPIDV